MLRDPPTLPRYMLAGAAFMAIALVMAVIVMTLWHILIAHGVRAQEPDSCRGFISPTCCCTNQCCFDVTEADVRPLDGDHWQIVATGQVLKRTGWSGDGRYVRCACDWRPDEGAWVRHAGANTRCLYVPHMGN